MSRYRLTAPLTTGPRGTPAAVRVGAGPAAGLLACELTWTGPAFTLWRILITGDPEAFPNMVLYDDKYALRHPLRPFGKGRQASEVLAAVLPFLMADGEGYRRSMGARPPADGWIFNSEVALWAYLHDRELSQLAEQLTVPTSA